jgi:cytochrome c5
MIRSTITTAALLAAAAVSAATAARAGEDALVLHDAPGRDLIAVHCVLCHSADYIAMNAPVMTRARWEASVKKMIEKLGAPIPAADAAAIVDYLSRHYSAEPPQ